MSRQDDRTVDKSEKRPRFVERKLYWFFCFYIDSRQRVHVIKQFYGGLFGGSILALSKMPKLMYGCNAWSTKYVFVIDKDFFTCFRLIFPNQKLILLFFGQILKNLLKIQLKVILFCFRNETSHSSGTQDGLLMVSVSENSAITSVESASLLKPIILKKKKSTPATTKKLKNRLLTGEIFLWVLITL